MARKPRETIQTQFRLRAETLADLDAITAYLTRLTGQGSTRSAAVRYALGRIAAEVRTKNKSDKSGNRA